MKMFLSLVTTLAFSAAFAQNVNVEGVSTSENTTIEIKKGSSASTAKKKYELTEGTDEISGDPDVLLKNAQNNHKAACKDWKAEVKENNKDHKIVSISCGTMRCTKEKIESVCKSTGTYKVRVLVEE